MFAHFALVRFALSAAVGAAPVLAAQQPPAPPIPTPAPRAERPPLPASVQPRLDLPLPMAPDPIDPPFGTFERLDEALLERHFELDLNASALAARSLELEERSRALADLERDRVRNRFDVDRLAPLRFDAIGMRGTSDEHFFNARPRAPWLASDPADSLYRLAREALNRGEYRRAAQLFSEVTRRFPSSGYAADCGYWEAYARYRIGTTDELKAAERALAAVARSAPASREADVDGLRARISGALAVRGDSRAVERVEESARQAGASCDQEDLAVRVEALSALSQMDASAALPIFRRVLERKDECFIQLRQRALLMLARRADSSAANLLAYSARNDPSPAVRADAVGYLAKMPGDGWIATVEDVLRTSDDERVQRSAMRALMSSDNAKARASLRGYLERKDASDVLRLAALDAFGRDRTTADDAAYLRGLYARVESERVKEAILGVVARIGGKDNQDWLAGIVRNTGESSRLRSSALMRLVRSDIPVADLAKMYDSADSRPMREQVIYALGSRKETEATDKLIEIAKNGTDPYMRKLAINYLSRKNDPRTTKLLMELIEK